MGCDCGKPKCDGHCGVSPAVLQINNPSECVLFHRVEVPASMGDSKANPPKSGAYKNVLLFYEADQTSWLYSSDGVPQKLVNGLTDYEDAINLPKINGVTLLGDKSSADLKLADAPMVITIASGNTSWSGADTAEDIYNFFLNQGRVNVVFEGSENYGYEIVSAAYIPGEQKMMCMVAAASIDTGSNPVEFSGSALYGLMTFYTVDKAVDVGEIDLQPKLFITDFTGLNMTDGYVLEGVPATSSSIGMVKPGDGLEVGSDGTLTVIDHVFDTVADMKLATDLTNGSYARTLGFHSINDGGGATYYITDSGTDDEMQVIAIGDLYANLVLPTVVNPEIFGAYHDGIHDDSDYIQKAIDSGLPVKMTKNYYLTGSVYIGNQDVSISNGYKTNVNIDGSASTVTYTGNASAFVIAGINGGNISFGVINASAGNCIEMWSSNGNVRLAYINLEFKQLNPSKKGIYVHSSNTGFINEIRYTGGVIYSGEYGVYIECNPSALQYHMTAHTFNNICFEGCDVCHYLNAIAQFLRGFTFNYNRYVENITSKIFEMHGEMQQFEFTGWGPVYESRLDISDATLYRVRIKAPILDANNVRYANGIYYQSPTTTYYIYDEYVVNSLTKQTGVTGTVQVTRLGNYVIVKFASLGVDAGTKSLVAASNNPFLPASRYYGTITTTDGIPARVSAEADGEIRFACSNYTGKTFDGELVYLTFQNN